MEFSSSLLNGKRYAILGLGKNGVAVAERLLSMGGLIQIWDDLPLKRKAISKKLQPYLSPLNNLESFDALILSPGIPHQLPSPHPVAQHAIAINLPILSDAELLFRAVRASGSNAVFVSITGTNGKSTTTVLLTHLLNQAGIQSVAGGNLGPAALALPLLGDKGVYVLEMSSYMLERLDTYKANISCLLNITPDHLERHGTMHHYINAKRHVFDRQNQQDLAIISIDDPLCANIATDLIYNRQTNVQTFSINQDKCNFYIQNAIIKYKKHYIANLNQAKSLPGAHNAQNALAASAIAYRLGLTSEQIQIGLNSFEGLDHRQKPVATIRSITFVNDSKATNADAAAKALSCYPKIVWIAGGLAKAGDIKSLVPYFPQIELALLIGKDAQILAQTLESHSVRFRIVKTLDKAVQQAYSFALTNKINTVLLSPACASFDQFKNFEERGELFTQLVNNLSKKVLQHQII
ncbi:UDP-N-acetylmuramoylalanine--D-glutamate ligase [Commensalibacter sp. Nvir]|uniref:UDP-N-acetylmuramoyl-L-alanine--D-glutamate ligase n=1 Tax=Commensalibacter sp. Nvir TaxID=3069817 RepID=UPI002D2454C5|nr:UDP-N-acetylmuramoylalanine--D-glutamate ligase [Commensalibacter sp. Nvir]